MGSRVLLSAVVLSCCLVVNVFGDFLDDNVSSTHAPRHAPSYSPAGAPAPLHHHHKGGHHHPKPASPPTAHPPTVAPVHSPVTAPVHAPVKAPVHPPVKAPIHPPIKAPVHPPVHAPVHPPVHMPIPVRKLVAVQGVVYCKSCKYKGVDTLLGATPVQGALVLLTCNNTKYPLKVKGTTDKNGYFFIMPPKTITTYGVHKCKMTLLSSPLATCNQPTNLHYGLKGAILLPTPKPPVSSHPLSYDVFTVGPFAFEPSPKTPCPAE